MKVRRNTSNKKKISLIHFNLIFDNLENLRIFINDYKLSLENFMI